MRRRKKWDDVTASGLEIKYNSLKEGKKDAGRSLRNQTTACFLQSGRYIFVRVEGFNIINLKFRFMNELV